MNAKQKLEKISKNFIKEYLESCGIKDTKRYLQPDASCFDNCWDYPNMSEAVDMLYNHATRASPKIGLLMD